MLLVARPRVTGPGDCIPLRLVRDHDHHDPVISNLDVHLDHHSRLEVIVARSVRHGRLTATTTGKDLPT